MSTMFDYTDPTEVMIDAALIDIDYGMYIPLANICKSIVIKNPELLTYLLAHVDILFADAGSAKPVSQAAAKIFGEFGGLYDEAAIHFVFCLFCVKKSASGRFAKLYDRYYAMDSKISLLFLTHAVYYGDLATCRLICGDSTRLESLRLVSDLPRCHFPIPNSTHNSTPLSYESFVPYSLADVLRDARLPLINNLKRLAVESLVQHLDFADPTIPNAFKPTTLVCKNGERVIFEHRLVKRMPFLLQRAGESSVDVSQILSSTTAVVLKQYLFHLTSPMQILWNPETIMWTQAKEICKYSSYFGFDSDTLQFLPFLSAAKELLQVRQAYKDRLDEDCRFKTAALFDLVFQNTLRFYGGNQYSNIQTILLSYYNDHQNDTGFGEIETKLRVFSLKQLAWILLVTTPRTDPRFGGICERVLDVSRMAAIDGSLNNRIPIKVCWSTASFVINTLTMLNNSESFFDQSLGVEVRNDVQSFAIKWLLAQYPTTTLPTIIIKSLVASQENVVHLENCTATKPIMLLAGDLMPNPSERVATLLPNPILPLILDIVTDCLQNISDESLALVFTKLHAKDPLNVIYFEAIWSYIHPGTGNTLLQMLLKIEFVKSAAILIAQSKSSNSSVGGHAGWIMSKNRMGESAIHLMAACRNALASDLNDLLIDAMIATNADRSSLCFEQTSHGNLLHYVCISGNREAIRLVIKDMPFETGVAHPLWDGTTSYLDLAMTHLIPGSDQCIQLRRVIGSFILGVDEWSAFDEDEQVYDDDDCGLVSASDEEYSADTSTSMMQDEAE